MAWQGKVGRSISATLAVAFVSLSAAGQTTIHVPAGKATIQAAIDAAAPGDTIAVAAGTYLENIDFKGKAIAVVSDSGPASTTIDGNRVGPVVSFHTGEGAASILQGFTIKNGSSAAGNSGGGVSVLAASPKILGNTIIGNAGCGGAGIGVLNGSPVIQDNVISNNTMSAAGGCSGGDGGGIFLYGAGTPALDRNRIFSNSANIGGGVAILNGAAPLVTENLVANNSATQGGGIYYQTSGAPLTIVANTIAGNRSVQGAGLYADPLESATIIDNVITSLQGEITVYCGHSAAGALASFAYNDVFSDGGAGFGGACADQTGLNHNIAADPLYSNTPMHDYHVGLGSPAIDSGDNGAVSTVANDLDGNPRLVDGSNSGATTADMGAFEFQGTTTMSVSPLSLTFADVPVGQKSSTQRVVVVNTGSRQLYVKALKMPTDFTEGDDCGGPSGVAPGVGCAIDVTFAPLSGGQHDETMTALASNVAGAGTDIALSGKGLAPAPSFSATSLTFADQLIFTSSPQQTVTLTNIGDADLVVTQVSSTVDYKMTHDCATLAPSAHCTLTITFSPVFVGPRPGRVSLFIAGVVTPLQINLTGNGIGPGLSISASSLTFSALAAGNTSAAQTFTITSTGTTALTINSITTNGDFAQTNDCPATLAVNAICTVSVAFAPTQAGTRTGAVVISHNAATSASQVFLSGTGLAPVATLDQTSLSFPAGVVVGTDSVPSVVVLSNAGDAPLLISSVTTTGDFAADASFCGASLAPGTACGIKVTFHPTASGARTGTLVVTDNAPGSPRSVSLSGTGLSGFPVPALTVMSPAAALAGSGDITLTITGAQFFPSTLVSWDGAAIPTTFVSSTSLTAKVGASSLATLGEHDVAVFNPAPDGGLSAHLKFTVYQAVPLSVRQMVFDPYRRVIYASVPSTATSNPNSIVSIDPDTQAVTTLVAIGNEPNRLALSEDGQYLYVGLDGTHEIRRIDLYSGSVDLTIPLGNNSGGKPFSAADIVVLPGNSHSIGAALAAYDDASPYQSVRIYDDAKPRAHSFDQNSPRWLASTGDSGLLFASSAGASPGNILKLQVDASGVGLLASTSYAPLGELRSDGTRLFTGTLALDPATLQTSGSFSFAGSPVLSVYAERGAGRTYLLEATTGPSATIWSGDSSSFVKLGQIVLPEASPSIGNLIRWNSDGLAFRSLAASPGGQDEVVLLRSSLTRAATDAGPTPTVTTLSPPSITMTAKNMTLLVNGTNFVTGAVVVFNGKERTTTFLSSTQLTAFIPGSDLTAAGTAAVAVVNPIAGGTASNTVGLLIKPEIEVSPASLVFTAQLIGKTSAGQPVSVTNNTSGSLAINNISLTGDFAQSNDCGSGSAIAAQSSCTITVTFQPSATGQSSGVLTINDAGAGHPHTVTLTGYGASVPVAVISATTLSFAGQLVGTTSAAQSIAIVNGGTQPLSITAITISGAFTQTNTCSATIAPGDHCGIAVAFAPVAAGSAAGSVTITHNADSSPAVVTLAGAGTDFSLASASNGSTSASVSAGGIATFNLSLGGSGGFAGPVALTCSGAPSLATCSISPPSITLSAAGPSNFTVTVTTTAPGAGSQSFAGGAGSGMLLAGLLALLTMMALALRRQPARAHWAFGAPAVAIAGVLLMAGCGGGGGGGTSRPAPSPGTPAGTYSITVTGASGTATRTVTLSLTVH